MFSDDIEKMLTEAGYRVFPHPDPQHRQRCRFFQATFWTKDNTKRFIEVYEWDFDGVTSFGGRSYEVVSTFETEAGHWVKCQMYTLKEGEVLSNMNYYESKLYDVFDLFHGVGQE